MPQSPAFARCLAVISIACVLLWWPPGAQAQTWHATAGNTTWSSGSSWVGNITPVNNGTADITLADAAEISTPSAFPSNLSTNFSIRSLTFSKVFDLVNATGTTPTLTIGSGGITVASTAVFVDFGGFNRITVNAVTLSANQSWAADANSAGLRMFNPTLNLGANTLTLGGNGVISVASSVTGGGKININGTGTYSLGDPTATTQSFTGGVTMSSGSLTIGGPNAYGSGGLTVSGGTVFNAPYDCTAPITVTGNCAFQSNIFPDVVISGTRTVTGSAEFFGSVNVATGNSLTTGSGQTVNYSGTNSWAGTVNLQGAHAIEGTTTITGTTNFNGSTLSFFVNGQLLINGGTLNMNTGVIQSHLGGFSVTNGGKLAASVDLALDGDSSALTSTYAVSGTNSTITTTGFLRVNEAGVLNITAGAHVTAADYTDLARTGNATLLVDGAGSQLTAGDQLSDWGSTGDATVTIQNGALVSAAGGVRLASSGTGSDVTVTVQSGGTLNAGVGGASLQIGNSTGANTASLIVTGGTVNNTGTAIIGSSTSGGGAGSLGIGAGGVFTSSFTTLNVNGSLTLSGGTANLGTFTRGAGNPTITFSSGALSFGGSFTVGDGGLLGSGLTLSSVRSLALTGLTTIDPLHTLTLSGGTLSTGGLVNNGTFNFTAGTLAITGGSGFAIGSGSLFGTAFTAGNGQTLQVANTLTVSGNLSVNGGNVTAGAVSNSGAINLEQAGSFNVTGVLTNSSAGRINVADFFTTTGAISNSGRLQLQNSGAYLGGAGTITNSGMITGAGEIAKPLTNSSAGTIQVEAGDTLLLSGANGANAGQINLNGGSLQFSQALTNAAGGFINGRGALSVTAGLTNNGVLALSAGFTDVRGKLTNASGGQIIVAGGATATFYDDVTHNGTEIRTVAGSRSVFLGAETGAGSFTGTGTVEFDGDLRPGNSPAAVSYAGDVILGGTASLQIQLGGLAAGSQYDQLNVAGALGLAGTLDVELINGFQPQLGAQFDVLNFSTLSGHFALLLLPVLQGGLGWDTSGLTSQGTLAVIPEPSMASLLFIGGASLAFRRKRR